MPPAEGRFEARLKLAALPYADLLKLAAKGAHHSADARRDADARIAAATPLGENAVAVLLSPDLAPQLFAALDLQDCAAAQACKAWSAAWAAKTRRFLRPTPLPKPDFKLEMPHALATLPGGERLAIAREGNRVQIVDKQMRLQHTIGDEASGVKFVGSLCGLAAGDGGLYVAERNLGGARLLRLQLDTFAVAAKLDGDRYTYHRFSDLALAPGGALFVGAERSLKAATFFGRSVSMMNWELLALDALTLEERFAVGKDVLGCSAVGGDTLQALAVCGDEVFVGTEKSNAYGETPPIRVLSLAGEPRRTIAANGWRTPRALCCVAERLYLTEMIVERFQARVFVLTPEGTTLRVWTSSINPASTPWSTSSLYVGSMCHFDGKLIMATPMGLLALRGL